MRSIAATLRLKAVAWRLLNAADPRIRFVAFCFLVKIGRPFDTKILRQLARELELQGSLSLAVRCWRMMYRLMPHAWGAPNEHLKIAVESGEIAQMRWWMERVRQESGLSPGDVVWLAGRLASDGHCVEASRVLASLRYSASESFRLIERFPSVVSPLVPRDLRRLSAELALVQSADTEGTALVLTDLARLCFTLGRLEVSAMLYRRVEDAVLSDIDHVAMWYAEARSLSAETFTFDEQLAPAFDNLADNPGAMAMLAYVCICAGLYQFAVEALASAVRSQVGALGGGDQIEADCIAILRDLIKLKDSQVRPIDAPLAADSQRDARVCIPKVFICGFGWSGSGAVYDDIRSSSGFCEFEGAGDAALLNADSGSEPTFVQAAAGLGTIWLNARTSGAIHWKVLWDMMCLHVVGVAGIGYNDYKSCSAAANNLLTYGHRYSGVFRAFVEGYLKLSRDAALVEGLRGLFMETTEALCQMAVSRSGARAVLFNNAVFGRDVEMLEIFSSCRAVVIFRHPLDVYVDRVRHDRNHWRSPRLLADLYGRNLRRYIDYKISFGSAPTTSLREVPFERYVVDSEFRERVRRWLLEGVAALPADSYFDPAISRGNIGIHAAVLDEADRQHMRSATTAYQEMVGLASESWAM